MAGICHPQHLELFGAEPVKKITLYQTCVTLSNTQLFYSFLNMHLTKFDPFHVTIYSFFPVPPSTPIIVEKQQGVVRGADVGPFEIGGSIIVTCTVFGGGLIWTASS